MNWWVVVAPWESMSLADANGNPERSAEPVMRYLSPGEDAQESSPEFELGESDEVLIFRSLLRIAIPRVEKRRLVGWRWQDSPQESIAEQDKDSLSHPNMPNPSDAPQIVAASDSLTLSFTCNAHALDVVMKVLRR